jgi:hypothetical protein
VRSSIAIAGLVAASVLVVSSGAVSAAPGGQGKGSGNSIGVGYGNGSGNNSSHGGAIGNGGGGGGAPLPLIGVTLLGQAAAAGGLYALYRRRRRK